VKAKYVFILIFLLSSLIFATCVFLLHPRGFLFDRDDPLGYYVYLRSAFEDHDLNFTNEYEYFQSHGSPLGANLGSINPITGKPDNNYTIGTSLLIAPFYAICKLASFPLKNVSWFVDQIFFSYGGLIVGVIGLWYSFRFVSSILAARETLICSIFFFLCSPAFYYVSIEPFLSHAAALTAVSAMLYFFSTTDVSPLKGSAVAGIAAGLTLLTRPQDAVLLLMPLSLKRLLVGKKGFAIVAGILPVLFLQMLVWHSIRGSYLSFPYTGFGFTNLSHPKIGAVLVSSNHGLLAWHPIILLCLLGWLIAFRNQKLLSIVCSVAFIIELFVTGSWSYWWMGHSFGQRAFVSFTPLFIYGLTSVYVRLQRKRIFVVICSLLFVWNMVLLLAYLSGVIPHEGEFSWLHLLKSLPDLPGAIVAKIHSMIK
jgi:hypothetical protein